MPIFLARQFVKHQVGGVWSEVSRRYVNTEPGVWFPNEWHDRPSDIKQGSGTVLEGQGFFKSMAEHATATSLSTYQSLLSQDAAPEEARTILPLNMMTTVVWTGSLAFWARVHNLRADAHAQLAAQELAGHIASIVKTLFPVCWRELAE